MPITSYLAIPNEHGKAQLAHELTNINNCEMIPSTNKDVVIVVIDSLTIIEEEKIVSQIRESQSIQQLTMVSGYQNK